MNKRRKILRSHNDQPQCFPRSTPRYLGTVHTTYRVLGEHGNVFHRVDGAPGWLFSTRWGETTMVPVAEVARGFVAPANLGTGAAPFSIEAVRAIARRHRAMAEKLNETSRVISFQVPMYDELGTEACARINVYYTTGTVGTALDHPRQGRTQLFRRCVTLQELDAIFRNPRVHTGRGYQRRANMPPALAVGAMDTSVGNLNEEAALRAELGGLDEHLRELVRERQRLSVLLDNAHTMRMIQERQEQQRRAPEAAAQRRRRRRRRR